MSLMLVLMLPQQLAALKSSKQVLYERGVAALALELGIKDEGQIGHVFPFAGWALSIVQTPVQKNMSIFGAYPLIDLREKVGHPFGQSSQLQEDCKGHLDVVEQIEAEPRFLKVRGWVFREGAKSTGDLFAFVGLDNQTKGYGLTGHERPDVEKAISKNARYTGFRGYVLASSQGKELFIQHNGMNCMLRVYLPPPLQVKVEFFN